MHNYSKIEIHTDFMELIEIEIHTDLIEIEIHIDFIEIEIHIQILLSYKMYNICELACGKPGISFINIHVICHLGPYVSYI